MNYYNNHAKEYIDNTKDVDMKEYYEKAAEINALSFIVTP